MRYRTSHARHEIFELNRLFIEISSGGLPLMNDESRSLHTLHSATLDGSRGSSRPWMALVPDGE